MTEVFLIFFIIAFFTAAVAAYINHSETKAYRKLYDKEYAENNKNRNEIFELRTKLWEIENPKPEPGSFVKSEDDSVQYIPRIKFPFTVNGVLKGHFEFKSEGDK